MEAIDAKTMHAHWLLAMVADEPDLTLDEIVLAMQKRRIAGSRSAVWRFFNRRKITFKKSLHAAEQEQAEVALARRRWSLFLAKKTIFLYTERSTKWAKFKQAFWERFYNHSSAI